MENEQKTFVNILIETANKQNDKVAIIENEGKLQTTYTELLSMARKIAYYINSKNIAEHSFIAVKLNDGRDYVAAEMGIWMAKCVSVPMGTTFPQQRIDYIMEHCESPLMIDDSVIAESQEMPEAEIKLPDVEDDAMLIYTSGSTGNPKGILHTFATIGNAFARKTDVVPRFTGELQYGNYAPMYFVAKLGVYGALLVGATVHFYSKELRTDIQKLSDYIEEYGINRSYIPPAALLIFKNKSKSLNYVTTGSEKLTTQYSKDGYEVINNYGMSETFASVAYFKLPDHPMDNVPVGKMAEGLEYVIADEEGNPVAEGEIGEMCFKEHLCKEYYKDPEKTAELFRGGLMHTGDLVREVDGLIYYIQRKDWMVKINGQRVEPSEVEVVIRKIDGVKNAVVKGFDSEDGSQYIVGYYILEDGATLTSEEVTAELSKSVPPYMVPRFMVEMKVFPINLNGKIDRKSLQSPEDTVDGVSTNYVAPTNDIEKQLCEAMAKLLGYKLLGIEDDFLSLGADSIRIMKLQQMCPDLGLSSRMIHTYRTAKAIAAQLAEAQSGIEASHVDVHEPQPLTQTQLGIYIECEKRQGEAVYNNPFLLRLDDDIDIQKFAVAVEIAVAAHPGVSATIMEAEDGTPMLYMPKEPWQQPVCTIEEVSDDELESIKHDLMQPFNLKSDRLYRARIFKTPTAKYVFFDFHHIIFDGTSMHIFLNDVSKAYTGDSVAKEVYTAYDVAYDEQQERNTDALENAKTWYAETFGESLEPTIPTGDIDDKSISFGHSIHEISITPEQLDAWCADHGITANVLATATFGKVLATYTNSDNALFATIYNGRSDLRTARTMDMLVKTFPVSVNIDKETTVQDLLNTTKQQMMGAMANDIYSFAELASDTGMTSDVMFVYQGDMHRVQTNDGLNFKGEHLDFNATGERFNVQMLSTPENTLILDIQYHANSYSEEFIARFAKAYNTALKDMTIREKVTNVQLLNEEEKAELLSIGCGNELKYDTNDTLVSIFRHQAAATPDATAVVYLNKQLTYGQLDDITDRLAAYLVKKGVGRETVVGVMITRSELMTVYPMAIMKAGGAYMPLDPEFPEDRLSFMIEDAGVNMILSTDGLVESVLPEFKGEVFQASQLAELPQVTASEIGDGTTPDSLMIILYTSGSTGKPKGVLLEQKSIVNFCHWYVRDFKMTSEDRSIAYANFGFDAHMMDIYPTYLAGATVHILDNEIRHDLDAMAEYINRNKITIAFMTTQICCQMASLFDMPSMRLMSAGGERMPHMECPKFDFYNGYGPTECSLFSTFYKVVGPFDGKIIGRPLSNYQLYVVDKYLNLVPLGAKGELVISGVAVGRCYLNRPDVNKDKFIEYHQKHAYRTGDEVRWTHCEEKPSSEYDIEYFGRMDGQVKLRGLRIELGEVESAMNIFPGIRQSAAAVKDMAGTQHLCGYYVTTDGESINEDELRAAMKQNLTDFMIPEFFVKVDAMPYNANGKVDRKRLPEPDAELLLDDAEVPRELNILEQKIVSMVNNLLGTDGIGVNTSLLRYGMSSLLAMRFAVQLFKEFGVKLKGKELANGTIIDIENAILENLMSPNAHSDNEADITTPSAENPVVIESAPLSYAQLGVYYDIVRNPGSISYNMPFICIFPEGISAEMLQNAVSAVVASHKILGTHFEIQGTEVVQVYPTDFIPNIEIETAETEEEYESIKADFVKPFNPATGPLYRIKIVSYKEKVHMFMDTLHLVMDGASEALFFKQLVDALSGIEPEVEKYNFFEHAIDEQKLSQTPEYAASEQFFTDALKTVDGVSNITEDLQPQEGAEGLLAYAERLVDMEKITEAARSLGVTPMSIFLAAAYYTVSRYTNTPDVCLCTISNGRSNLLISETVGMFVNTVAITSHITDISVKDFIIKTAEDFSATLDHENYPFARIAEKFGISPTLFFQYQVGVLDDIMVKIPGTENYGSIKREGFAESTPKFKFTISIESKPENGVAVQIQYDDSLYSQQLSQGFADAMAAVIEHFIADVNASLKTVSMLNEEQAALIATFHETKKADVPILLYHKLFENSAEKHADELALVALNPYTKLYETYTYAKLNEQMNRIAHSLIERGVKPCDRVAILLPRTSRLIMSQYGILKAGGAYIPCDPKYPTERINLILEDSESKYIITTKDRLSEFPDKAIDVEELLVNSEQLTVNNGQLTVNNDASGNPDVQVSPDDLAYLIYTSGSTGRPKGVQLMHKGVCNYHHGENLIQSCLKNECHAALGITTISFDMSVWETGSPLMHGKTLVFVGDDDCNDPNRLAMLISDYGVDCMTATTSRFMQLLESPAFEEVFSKQIHLAYQGGEGLSVALLHKLQSYPNVRIFNGYGPTETIANSHASELTHDTVAHIGKPCVNYTNFIIDNDGNELPVGVVGELVIGGRSVAKGYNNLPEQTASRFVEYQGQRVYKSGDYARWMPDGNVVLLGRKDNQVKLRGLRIELGEVESAITKVEGVKNVTVMIKKLAGKDHLCAYFTADRPIAIDDMKEEISKTLTHYMVPTAYLQMEAFPLTPNGKTDVKNLPEPELAKVGGDYVAPNNATEADFCDIFGLILELDKVSVVDSFFDLGGSSLTATRVVIEATNKGYQVSYAEVFDNPTPRKLARLVSGASAEDSVDQEIVDYDYTTIDNILAENNLDNFLNGERLELGDVILTGANGYLGIHILRDLLENHIKQHPENKVYCLVRHGRNGVTSKARLRNLLFYYFEKNYKDLFDTQLIVIDGDVTSDKAFEELEKVMQETNPECKVRTLINCAAIVKHFSEGTEIEDINIGGLQKCVDFCLKTGTQLIQTSTNSTAGQLPQSEMTPNTQLDEQHSYLGQVLKSKYTRSKFLAERIVLSAVVNEGLVGKVMRLGNLSPRSTDGEFQINFRSNSSMGRLHIYQMLGVYGYGTNEIPMEFSPIDEVAHAVLELSQTPKECVVFHPINNHFVLLGDVVREMANTLDINIDEVEDEIFRQKLQEAGQDPEKAKVLQSMLAYANGNDNLVYIPANNNYSNRVLSRLGFHWNVTSWDYVQKFIKAIATLDFFEDKR